MNVDTTANVESGSSETEIAARYDGLAVPLAEAVELEHE